MSGEKNKRKRPPHPKSTKETAMLCAAAAWSKKGEDLVLLEVTELTGYADYFLLVNGRSTRQAAAIAGEVRRVLKKAGVKLLGEEGLKGGTWACLDYGDVVVHVFHEPVRHFYDLDSLWGDAPRLEPDAKELENLIPPEPDSKPHYEDWGDDDFEF